MRNKIIDVSVIIVNYNTKDLTIDCLDSIYKNTTDINFEVIVVDNASEDGSIELLNNYKNIILIKSKKNLGFGKANNLGYKYSKGKYIFLLNSDTILLNNAIKDFYLAAEHTTRNIVCWGSLLLNKKNKIIHSFGEFPTCFNTLLHSLNFYTKLFNFTFDFNEKKYIQDTPFIVDYVTGADLFIRRDIIEECGFFDPDFFLYYEETDMQKRYSDAGYKSMIILTPQIIHLDGGSSGKKNKPTFKQLSFITKSRFLYLKKHNSYLKYILFRIIYFITRFIPILFNNFSFTEKISFFKILIK